MYEPHEKPLDAYRRDGSFDPAQPNPSILIACELALTRIYLTRHLEQAGFNVHVASTGAEAIDRYFELGGKIDVLLVDAGLRDLPAPAFYARFRRHSGNVPCCFFSTANNRDAADVREMGAEVITWPVSMDELATRLRGSIQATPVSVCH
jgi:DNA-binding response OmpR family regulator